MLNNTKIINKWAKKNLLTVEKYVQRVWLIYIWSISLTLKYLKWQKIPAFLKMLSFKQNWWLKLVANTDLQRFNCLISNLLFKTMGLSSLGSFSRSFYVILGNWKNIQDSRYGKVSSRTTLRVDLDDLLLRPNSKLYKRIMLGSWTKPTLTGKLKIKKLKSKKAC